MHCRAVTTLPRVAEFLSETFIYECKGWDIWGLPPLEYPGLAKVSFPSITLPYLQIMIDKVPPLWF